MARAISAVNKVDDERTMRGVTASGDMVTDVCDMIGYWHMEYPSRMKMRGLALLALLALLLLVPGRSLALDWEGKIHQDIRDLGSPNSHVRKEALTRIGLYPASRSGKYILKALDDLNPQVQRKAAALAMEKKLRRAVPKLVGWLSSWDENMRVAAAASLGRMGDNTVIKSLVRALSDPEHRVRLAVVKALGQLHSKDRQEVVPLLGRLGDSNGKVRQAVIEVLSIKKDRRSVIPLMARLNDPAKAVRLAAVKALGEIGDKGAGPTLVRLIKDPAVNVAAQAIQTLGKLRYAPATEPLIDLLKSEQHTHRKRAAMALADLRTRHAIRALVAGLFDARLRSAVKEALVSLGKEVTPDLVVLLRDPRIPGGVLNAVVDITRHSRLKGAVPLLIQQLQYNRIPKLLIINTLSEIADSRIQRPLLELLDHRSDTMKMAALNALDRVIDERAAGPLIKLLDSPNSAIRLTVIRYLGRLRARNATGALLRIARAKTPDHIARAAVSALAMAKDPKATKGLIYLLGHRDRLVRRMASQALGRIHDLRSMDPLLELCKRSAGAIRTNCLQAIGGVLRGRTSAPALSFLSKMISQSDHSIFLAAVDALAAMKDPKIPAMLLKIYPALPPALRRKVAEVLGNDPGYGKIALPFLLGELESAAPPVRSAAAWAIGKLRDPGSSKALLLAARDKDWKVRVNVIASLARLVNRKNRHLLKTLTMDPVPYVRANAIIGLAWLKDRKLEQLMIDKLLKDRSPWVRINALRGLSLMKAGKLEIADLPKIKTLKQLVERTISEDVDPRVRETASSLLERPLSREGSWVGMFVMDQQRKPFRNGLFLLITPSGLVKAAYSDGRSEAWEENLVDGYCFSEVPPPSLDDPASKI